MDKNWLNPILTESLPRSMLDTAADLISKADKLLQGLVPQTAKCVSNLMRVTNAYHSNLIEGYYIDPSAVVEGMKLPLRQRQQLGDPAVTHIHAQEVLERALRLHSVDFKDLFEPAFISAIHRRLFSGLAGDDGLTSNETIMVPGTFRNKDCDLVTVGAHVAPEPLAIVPMLKHLQWGFGSIKDPGRRLIAVLANHHRLAFVHPFLDGNGRVTRLVAHLQLAQIGLHPQVWSLPRGLYQRREAYYSALAKADRAREGDLDGRGQLSQKHYFAFIEFMLDVCHEQVDYMAEALSANRIIERVTIAFNSNLNLDEDLRPGDAETVKALLARGSLQLEEFKILSGLQDLRVEDEVKRMIDLGLVCRRSSKPDVLEPAIPIWLAQGLFPNLHTAHPQDGL